MCYNTDDILLVLPQSEKIEFIKNSLVLKSFYIIIFYFYKFIMIIERK